MIDGVRQKKSEVKRYQKRKQYYIDINIISINIINTCLY